MNIERSKHYGDSKDSTTKRSRDSDICNQRPIRERLPLPDLGMMRRMMTNIHNSNQNAEIRDKSASQRKLEVGIIDK